MSEWVRESYGPEPDQFFERFIGPDSKAPLIVAIHGGYWKPEHDREHMRPLSEALARKGHEVILAEYRRIPGNPDASLDDITSILNTLAPRNLVLLGFSAGGHLALLAAKHCQLIDAIICLAPVTDLERTEREDLGESAVKNWLQIPAALRKDLNPILDHSYQSPIRIFHGDRDERVPVEHSRDFVEEMQQADIDAQLMELPNIGHFEMMDPSGVILEKILELFNY